MSPRMVTKRLQANCQARRTDQQPPDQQPSPKIIYSYINKRLKPSDKLLSLKNMDGHLVAADDERASMLTNHFASVFSAGNQHHQPVVPTFSKLDNLSCSSEEVGTLLCLLESSKSPVSDGFHPLFLGTLSVIIFPSATTLYNKSLELGVLRQEWKDPVVKPFLKTGPEQLWELPSCLLDTHLRRSSLKIVKKAPCSFLEKKSTLGPV
ncbi:hypothetical protein CRM22_003907 [Opisthorchis felineus]|uniref:Uncharacterized protein n=1 Tax=Opisthorchis felineus TaxID=147828 RepID=A0A4S2M523_OPIFE|nr:hypothetical protein CRM22_003907 [Opisthorchis felineus]